MIKVNIKEILKEQNKSKYWLSQKLDLNYQRLNMLLDGDTTQITFRTIDKLCYYLNCTVGELFTFVPENEDYYKCI